jgi:hypothetical protein
MIGSEGNSQPARYNFVSIMLSTLTIVSLVAIYFHGLGGGASVGGHFVAFIIVAGVGLTAAFIFAFAAMVRGEQPLALTLAAFGLPAAFVAILILGH